MKVWQRLHSLKFCLDLPVTDGDVLKCLSMIISLASSLWSLWNSEKNFSPYILNFFISLLFSFLTVRLRLMKVRSLDIISQTMKLSSLFPVFFSLYFSLYTMSSRSLIFCTAISNLQLTSASEFLSTDNICSSLGVWLSFVLSLSFIYLYYSCFSLSMWSYL